MRTQDPAAGPGLYPAASSSRSARRPGRTLADIFAALGLLAAWVLLWVVFVAGVLEPGGPLLAERALAHPSVAPAATAEPPVSP
ncbi:MAG TPA: hypothetical protein VFG59_02040 [Anaeromyxobacter sp.]|nr:hypothetical protein [Anaeromyxobacter sp.]